MTFTQVYLKIPRFVVLLDYLQSSMIQNKVQTNNLVLKKFLLGK